MFICMCIRRQAVQAGRQADRLSRKAKQSRRNCGFDYYYYYYYFYFYCITPLAGVETTWLQAARWTG